ncbi:fosfomycin resistance glutathione transferase [Aeromonas bestiarum]|uniref:fosfomycin resistance glutathione transferase n=1 Tax=Aeromonas bestiarum TaxID=105751 RepID=UPI0023787CA7|nr:fosfomycin resistance glutathione transferase [Aeromonas bestiarum]EKP0277839.1 fosfomycin resistance glutathione transferase [Aeromonas bestiarum]WDL81979.1 fosfomycin resistance glutathione transferase [Aeromonas bestiarum]
MLTGLNHLTLATADLEKSFVFYVGLLGCRPRVRWARGAYLTLGDLWLCLSCDAPSPAQDYTHIAFTISPESFTTFCANLRQAGIEEWKNNSSEGDSLYLKDPDGHRLEIHAGNLESRLASLRSKPYEGLTWFE